jgi:hypothetical protein
MPLCSHFEIKKLSLILLSPLTMLLTPLMPDTSFAQKRVDVAIVLDGLPDRTAIRNTVYVDELKALTSGEFDVRVHEFPADAR